MSTLVINGTCSVLASGGGTSAALSNLTTSGPGVVVVFIQTNSDPPQAVTVTDTAGLNWVLAAQDSQQGFHIHAFEAKSVSALTNDVITVHVAGGGSGFIVASGSGWRGGLDLNSPFDSGVSPVVTTSDPISGSTTFRSTVALAAFRTGEFTPTIGAGWTGIYNNQFGSFFCVEYQRFTSVQGSVNATLTTGAGTGNGSILLILAESPILGASAVTHAGAVSLSSPITTTLVKFGSPWSDDFADDFGGNAPEPVPLTSAVGLVSKRVQILAGSLATIVSAGVVSTQVVNGSALVGVAGVTARGAVISGVSVPALATGSLWSDDFSDDFGDGTSPLLVVAGSGSPSISITLAGVALTSVASSVTVQQNVVSISVVGASALTATIESPNLWSDDFSDDFGGDGSKILLTTSLSQGVGAACSTAAGIVTPVLRPIVDGRFLTTGAGAVSFQGSLFGAKATADTGAVIVKVDAASTGAITTTAAGVVSFIPVVQVPVFGAAATRATGVVSKLIAPNPIGATVAAAAGTAVTLPVATITTAVANLVPGQVTPSVAAESIGAVAPTTVGELIAIAPGQASVSGVSAAATPGSIVSTTSTVECSLIGATVIATTGILSFNLHFGVLGAAIASGAGAVVNAQATLVPLVGASASVLVSSSVPAVYLGMSSGVLVAATAGVIVSEAVLESPGPSVFTSSGSVITGLTPEIVGAISQSSSGEVAVTTDAVFEVLGTSILANSGQVGLGNSPNISVVGVAFTDISGVVIGQVSPNPTLISATTATAFAPSVVCVAATPSGAVGTTVAGEVGASSAIDGASAHVTGGQAVPAVRPIAAGAVATLQAPSLVAGSIAAPRPLGAAVGASAGLATGGVGALTTVGDQALVTPGNATFGQLVVAHGASAIVVVGSAGFQFSSNVVVFGVECVVHVGSVHSRNVDRKPKGSSLLPFQRGRGSSTSPRRRSL